MNRHVKLLRKTRINPVKPGKTLRLHRDSEGRVLALLRSHGPRKRPGRDYPAHLAYIRSLPCVLHDHPSHTYDGPVDPHHLISRNLTADDRLTVPLCRGCHDRLHMILGRHSFAQRYGVDLAAIADDLWHRSPANPENTR